MDFCFCKNMHGIGSAFSTQRGSRTIMNYGPQRGTGGGQKCTKTLSTWFMYDP